MTESPSWIFIGISIHLCGKKEKRQLDKRTGVWNPSILGYGLIIPLILQDLPDSALSSSHFSNTELSVIRAEHSLANVLPANETLRAKLPDHPRRVEVKIHLPP